MIVRARLLGCLVIAALLPGVGFAQAILTEGTNLSPDVSTEDGRIAFDLLGSLWVLDARGGQATEIKNTALPARSPRWSPDGTGLLYESSSPDGNSLWLYNFAEDSSRILSTSGVSDQNAAWHPDGDRVVFSSASSGSGMDLWELDLATGLRWRLTHEDGDETDAAWSENGRHLVYVAHKDDRWQLVVRLHGQPDRVLVDSAKEIRVPSWRPDNSLVTFLAASEENGEQFRLDMVILSEPLLIRPYSTTESDLFVSPVSWQNRQTMVYAGDGVILRRDFGDRRAKPVEFRAVLDRSYSSTENDTTTRELADAPSSGDRFLIRAARVFDGVGNRYLRNIDIITSEGRIETLGSQLDASDAIVLDLGDVTILPGFIDIYSALPAGDQGHAGAALLAYGVTTIATEDAPGTLDSDAWHGADTPGPRLLSVANIHSASANEELSPYLVSLPADTALDEEPRAAVRDMQTRGIPVFARNWTTGLGLGVDMLLGADALPASPQEHQYQDMRFAASGGQIVLISGLADSATPGLEDLLQSRQAKLFGNPGQPPRRFATTPRLGSGNTAIVLGSRPNGLAPGLALHAEFLAMAAAGLTPVQILKSAGADAARALRLPGQVGTIVPGAAADLVVIAGDPLADIRDSMKIMGVVRNGRFFSLISLLEQAGVE